MQPFHYRAGRLFCEEVPAQELAADFGTPLYIYSREALVTRAEAFGTAFAPASPLIAYSVKANGNLSILRILAELGVGADIVSGGELHRAQLAGIPGERIVFSGVGKTQVEMEAALAAKIYSFNVESEGELRTLSAVAAAHGCEAPVALRVNPDVEPNTPHHYTRTGQATTKFGVPYGEARRLYELAATLPGLRIRGIDVHIGSQVLDPEPYRLALRRIAELVDALREDGLSLEFLDCGGGYGVSYDDAREPAAPDFAAVVLPTARALGLRLVLEPGRFIVAPAGILLTRVLYLKEMGGRTYVIVDAGMNDLLRPSHYSSYHRVLEVEEHPDRAAIRADIVGPICESGDFLALDRSLQSPRPGDLLAVGTVGAYGFAMASTYNARPRPAEVIVAGSSTTLARRRETYDDLVRGEVEFLSNSQKSRRP